MGGKNGTIRHQYQMTIFILFYEETSDIVSCIVKLVLGTIVKYLYLFFTEGMCEKFKGLLDITIIDNYMK